MPEAVALHFDEQRATLSLMPKRLGKPPTLDHEALEQLDTALANIEGAIQHEKRDPRAVVVSAHEPGKYFCVGADINALGTLDPHTIKIWVRHGHAVFNRLAALPIPVIAVIDGYALGGGLELALACDFILASDRSRFGQPECRLGLVPGWGGTERLPRRIGVGPARRLCLTGEQIDAAAAKEVGLLDCIVPADELCEAVNHYVDDICTGSPLAISHIKALLDPQRNQTHAGPETNASINVMQDPVVKERIRAFLQAR